MSENISKIIGVGFQKTGTSSLRDALEILGYKVGDNNYKLLFPILHGNWRKVWKTLDRYDAVEDNPWPLIYKEIDAHVPGCKFILTIRDEDTWFDSVNRHIGDLRNPMHEWIYGWNKGLPADDRSNTIRIFNDHNAGVLEYFKDRQGDLLILNFEKGDSWEKLCAFLGKGIPKTAFPHANREKGKARIERNTLKKMKFLKKRIKYYLQISYLRFRGLL